ncbi:hypothetical protein BDV95DRAFT_620020 [Massariosphaeria phaeospora]|uniref:Uncharacterized protein n=1 Tax=Massariosphaeria phaeospora TaxID=100035 RepID=A0A7C8MM17_9PLEO|nr:hypothetical protein BDV95DRAFT_620020 [Massariosphaeria phaeospora]
MKFSIFALSALPFASVAAAVHSIAFEKPDVASAAHASAEDNFPMAAREISSSGATVSVILGNQKQNVGELTGKDLYDKIHAALYKICAVDDTGLCSAYNTAKIDHVAYKTKTSVGTRGGHLEISVRQTGWAPFPNPGLKKALIETVAATFSKGSEDQKNCADAKQFICGFRGQCTYNKTYHLCNVGDKVTVEIPGTPVRMDVELRFKARDDLGDGRHTPFGKFDCFATLEATEKSLKGRLPAFAEGIHRDKVSSAVKCTSNDITSADPSNADGFLRRHLR